MTPATNDSRSPRLPLPIRVLPLLLALGLAQAQDIELPRQAPLQGDPLTFAVSGLQAGQPLTLRVSRRLMLPVLGPRLVRAEARFIADAQGRVDPAHQAALDGSYTGVESQGLLWSAQPVQAGQVSPELAEGQVLIEAFAAAPALDGARPLAQARLQIQPAGALVKSRAVPGFPGAQLVLPRQSAAGERLGVVVVLGGSEGGSGTALRMAEAFAARGLAAFALPYYSPTRWGTQGPLPPELPTLPSSFGGIELDRLEAVRDWLQQQPEVDARRIALWGVSKGGEFALAAASRMPWLQGVVAVVPSDVIWQGFDTFRGALPQASFRWHGEDLAFVPYEGYREETSGFLTGQPVVLRRPHDAGRRAHPGQAAAARIEVERFHNPVLLIAGSDDQVWDSAGMAREAARRRAEQQRPTELLIFEGAGHGISGLGELPTALNNAGPMKMGGQPAADAHAQAECWARTLRFLRAVLERS